MTPAQSDLLSLFLRLAPIDGISHAERTVADEVSAILRSAGILVKEDDAAPKVRGSSGNLFCFPPDFDRNAPAIVLEAHLDTVQSTTQLKPVVHDDRVTSDGTTILGADNRMGLSVLVDLLRNVARTNRPHSNFLVLLTVCEETGLYGADVADLTPFNIKSVYVFDCSKRPGIYIRESVGLYEFTAEFVGKAAHAGVAPEEGISAIAMAASAISKIQLGRIDPDTTANIGKIRGGEAVNVVPDKVLLEGEVRSFYPEKIRQHLSDIERVFAQAAGGTGRLTFQSTPFCEPYVHTRETPAVVHLERAMIKAGLKPQPIRYMGGSDANKYNAKGIPSVNIGIGAQKPHSTEEYFLLEDLFKASEIAHALLEE